MPARYQASHPAPTPNFVRVSVDQAHGEAAKAQHANALRVNAGVPVLATNTARSAAPSQSGNAHLGNKLDIKV